MDEDVVVIGDLRGAALAGDVVMIEEDENPLPKHAVRNDDGTVTLPLRVKVALTWKKPGGATSEDTYESLTMRRLTGKDMIAIQSAARDQAAVVAIARSAGIPPHLAKHVFERMDGADIKAAGDVVSHFLASGPTTSRKARGPRIFLSLVA